MDFNEIIEEVVMKCLRRYFSENPQSDRHEPEKEKKEMTIAEVMERFSISRQTIYGWQKKGKLTPHKIEGRIYFLTAEVDSLMSNNPKYRR